MCKTLLWHYIYIVSLIHDGTQYWKSMMKREKNIISCEFLNCLILICIKKIVSSSAKNVICQTLAEISPVILKKKIYKNIAISLIAPYGQNVSLFWTNFNLLYARMLCAKFRWNWPCGSGVICKYRQCISAIYLL